MVTSGFLTSAPRSLHGLELLASQVALVVKSLQETQVQSLGREDSPGGGHGNPLQYSCLENPCGQRSQAGYSPRGRKELDTTKVTWHTQHWLPFTPFKKHIYLFIYCGHRVLVAARGVFRCSS